MTSPNVAALATVWSAPNYIGEIYRIGATKTPFLNMIGGLQGGQVALVQAMQFPVAQPWNLNAAAQPAITETASLTAATYLNTYVRGVDVNTCQIFEYAISASYAKQSVTGVVMADATTAQVALAGPQPVQNEMDWQATATLQQAAVDIEMSFLQGAYQQATSASVAAKTRGLIEAAQTNKVNASSAYLTKALMDQMFRTMAANGAIFQNVVLFANAFQKQKLTAIYGYAPEDRNVGGTNIKQIETDFGMVGVVWAPMMAVSVVLAAELAVCRPVFCPVPGKGVLFRDRLAKTGAADSEMIYGQVGLDHGPEEYHGQIYGLLYT
jgi:hypothetical protein